VNGDFEQFVINNINHFYICSLSNEGFLSILQFVAFAVWLLLEIANNLQYSN